MSRSETTNLPDLRNTNLHEYTGLCILRVKKAIPFKGLKPLKGALQEICGNAM